MFSSSQGWFWPPFWKLFVLSMALKHILAVCQVTVHILKRTGHETELGRVLYCKPPFFHWTHVHWPCRALHCSRNSMDTATKVPGLTQLIFYLDWILELKKGWQYSWLWRVHLKRFNFSFYASRLEAEEFLSHKDFYIRIW